MLVSLQSDAPVSMRELTKSGVPLLLAATLEAGQSGNRAGGTAISTLRASLRVKRLPRNFRSPGVLGSDKAGARQFRQPACLAGWIRVSECRSGAVAP
jgi:hypothetical protein